jgi:hypothetical protein
MKVVEARSILFFADGGSVVFEGWGSRCKGYNRVKEDSKKREKV